MAFKLTRRKFLYGSLAVCLGAVVDVRFLEPRWLRVTHVKVKLPGEKPARPFRILHLADMHASDHVPVPFIRRAIELGLSHEPDITCLTGDLITCRIPSRDEYIAALRLLSKRGPCYACFGNHDGGAWVNLRGGYPDTTEMQRFLEEAGISVLFNEAVEKEINGTMVRLVGLGDYWARGLSPERAFSPIEPSSRAPCIVLSHNPDTKETLDGYSWDLMLCGHTHGGQLSLPLVGTPFAPVRDRRFVEGLNEWKGRLIHTTRGVGNLHGMRFNCRPEISILDVV